MKRKFVFNKETLQDPGAHMTPSEVLSFYCNSGREDLLNASIDGPVIDKKGIAVYEFKNTAGKKG